ncbi:MucR family transcriptional regulator [Oceanibacterium hippocampi]|uniref:Transcriptional regulatory protein ros n=1 Tax=Oceanibacterium hippocampi TaxID=745714 RepID=A0A1Y5RK47_9PROT|nr:MucR family transcriptional regulator [Oceanibacterium hippocampi]SLN19492.1 Transcriptional regulatory protein ros [Oceanibacterium hippocampi]
MSEPMDKKELMALTTEIVTSHLSNNKVEMGDLPRLIRDVYGTLAGVGSVEQEAQRQQPAVPVRRSVTPDFLICLEDGKKLKMLKRHLKTAYDMSPEDYRLKWNLPPDYPMVAPNYASQRRELAKSIGLGTNRRRSSKRA